MLYTMLSLLPMINFWLAVGGVVLFFVTVGLGVDFVWLQSRYYIRYVERFVWPLVIVVTIGSVVLSLIYSEYFGFVPCSLCWLQRIALYPQALFVLMAVRTRDQVYFPLYSIGLSLCGLVVALYHHVYQLLPHTSAGGSLLPCLADGSSDCATLVIFEFGFVTFPLLSGITFAFLIVLYLNLRRRAKAQISRNSVE